MESLRGITAPDYGSVYERSKKPARYAHRISSLEEKCEVYIYIRISDDLIGIELGYYLLDRRGVFQRAGLGSAASSA